jgi:hypothetical protein
MACRNESSWHHQQLALAAISVMAKQSAGDNGYLQLANGWDGNNVMKISIMKISVMAINIWRIEIMAKRMK